MGEAFPGAVGTGGNEGFPGGGRCGLSPAPLERAGTVPSRAGPHFSGEMGERAPRGFAPWTPVGERVSFPHTPFLWPVVEVAWFFDRSTWPAASKTNASWPAHQLGRAGEVVRCREEKVGNGTVTLCLLPKGTFPRPQPAQPVGGPLRAFQCEGRRPGIPSEVQPPPTPPHQRRGSRGRNLLPRGFFPLFLPRNRAPAGKPRFPAVPTAKERNRKPPVRASPAQTAPPPAPRTAGRRDG